MFDASLLSDRTRFARWVEASADSEAFWRSAPAWGPSAVWRVVDGELVVWADRAPASFGPVASAVAVHFDGVATLAELAADLSDAIGGVPDAARTWVATAASELAVLGAIEGIVTAPVPPSWDLAPAGDPVEPTAGSGSAGSGVPIRVEQTFDADGRPVTIEHLADGTRRMVVTFELGAGPLGAEELAAYTAGDRSMAELVPQDSCLGAKIRNFDEVALLSVRCADGAVRSVRCHDAATAQELSARLGPFLEPGAKGRIEAFVVTPLEGAGPVRIYDGGGNRRGRPRTPQQAAHVAEQLLGEATAQALAASADGPLPLELAHLTKTGVGSVIVPRADLEAPGVPARLVAAGWEIGWQRLQIDEVGRPSSPTPTATPDRPAVDPVVALPGAGDWSSGRRITELLAYVHDVPHGRGAVLDRLVAFAERVAWTASDHPLPMVLARIEASR